MWRDPLEVDKFSGATATYIQTVCVLLGDGIGDEAAAIRVIEMMDILLRSMLQNAPPEETAFCLTPEKHRDTVRDAHYLNLLAGRGDALGPSGHRWKSKRRHR
jgi:hypothetical protein